MILNIIALFVFLGIVAVPAFFAAKGWVITEETVASLTPRRYQESENVALKVLNLEQGATDREIQQAHRKLMKENHPDMGGSRERASRINLARDILLKKAS